MHTLRSAPPHWRHHAHLSRRHRQGSIIVNAAVGLSVAIVLLLGIQLGYAFYMKRELQKTVDLAALAGAQVLSPSQSSCDNAKAVARTNATQNLNPGFGITVNNDVQPGCGRWGSDITQNERHFLGEGAATPSTYNAMRVQITAATPIFIPGMPAITWTVEAVAMREEPTAVFTVGSNLINTNPEAPLMDILRWVGVDPNIDLVTYRGLAGVKITPSGLLQQLGLPITANIGAGELDTLLAARQVTLSNILDAIVTVGGKSGLLSTNAYLLGQLQSAGVNINKIFTVADLKSLFALVDAPTSAAALSAQVNALSFVSTAVAIGAGDHAATLDLGIGNVANLLGLTATTKVRIIEPPSIGIGGEGTTAYNSQIRLFTRITAGGSGGLLSPLLNLLGTRIDLPIMVDLVNTHGRLLENGINCATSPHTAKIRVQSSVLNTCIGKPTDLANTTDPIAFENAVFSKKDICETGLSGQTLVKLLGVPLLSGKAYVPALSQVDDVTLSPGETVRTPPNGLALGNTVADLTDQLLNLLLAQSGSEVTVGPLSPDVAVQTADLYLAKAGTVSGGKYNVNQVKTLLQNADLTWGRPCSLLSLGTCPMPDKFIEDITPVLLVSAGCSGSTSTYNSCVRTNLINELQTTAGGGLLSSVLGLVGDVLTGLLGGGTSPGTPKQSLLAGILSPVIEILRPVLNLVGSLISNQLSNTIGLDLGRSDVTLQSLSCNTAKLVY